MGKQPIKNDLPKKYTKMSNWWLSGESDQSETALPAPAMAGSLGSE